MASACRATAALISLAAPTIAQDRGSVSDQDACRPEVFRLCMAAIPDETEIVACLQHRLRDLTPACRVVIAPEPHKRKLR